MLRPYLVYLLLLLHFPAMSDSLSNKLEAFDSDSSRLIYIDSLLESYVHHQPRKAIRLTHSATQIIDRMESSELVVRTNYLMGDNYRAMGMYDQALRSYSKAQRMAESQGYKRSIAEVFIRMGDLYLDEQVYPLAQENYFRARDYFRSVDDLPGLSTCSRKWGEVRLIQKDFDAAEKSFRDALETAQNSKDLRSLAAAYISLGKLHDDLSDHVKSLEFYEKSVNLLVSSRYSDLMAEAHTHMGEAYMNSGNFQKALENYIQAHWIYKSTGDKQQESNSYLALARLYLREGDYRQVENLAGQALSIAREFGLLLPQKDAYQLLAQASIEVEDYPAALRNFQHYSLVKDSIFNANIANVIADVEVRNESEKKNREIALLEKGQLEQQVQLAEKNAQRNTLLVVLIFAVIIALILFYLYWSKNLATKLIVESKQKAEEATRAKANFLSTMSHEIRTPMNAIIGMSHLLNKEDLTPDRKEKVDIINFSANNLLNLINDILDFSKIESGKIEFEKVEFKPRELLRNLYKTFEARAKEKRIGLHYKVDNAIPENVKGDPSRLSQILINLISNALKFTHKGEVSILVNLSTVIDEQVELEFKVIDTGIGIPRDKHKLIFESFSQAEADTTRKYGGTGLGLAITKSLTELQNGSIRLVSQPGLGSEFIVRIPYEVAEAKPETPSQDSSPIANIKKLEGKRVLVVEDDLVNQKVAENILAGWNLEIDIAENGVKALKRLEENDYDIILMDLHMPEMDGYEAAVAIRQMANVKKKNIPIVALTADAFVEVKERILEVDMNDFVSKPFIPAELQEKLIKNMSA
jgi:signal transduction histidine kinase/CheY-like chemotaxis protein